MTALTITKVTQSTIGAIEVGGAVLGKVASYMDAAEKLKDSTLSGEQKRAWVIEFAKKEITEVLDNLGYWLPMIMRFINAAKAAFNALKVVF